MLTPEDKQWIKDQDKQAINAHEQQLKIPGILFTSFWFMLIIALFYQDMILLKMIGH